ncbi:hypothetical protein SD81_040605 [Tolypothrix campylonemoides VB511288]|nr:hypothetical protein SD81_040605 [Tolypothrix campylonemoides VB511288]
MRKLDSRKFSQEAYTALTAIATDTKDLYYLDKKYHKKASGVVQGLIAYISTWGLHRLSGDAKKFLNGKAEDTKYKGKIYKKFLRSLKSFSGKNFNVDDEGSLLNMPLKEYTALNRLAIELAREWSFWASAVLGEPEE